MNTVHRYAQGDLGFPELFSAMPDPPKELFVRGVLPDKTRTAVAIVGTRKPTAYGMRLAHDIAYALAEQGVIIVSGLAYGVDGNAHRAALEAKGCTVAVLAGSPLHNEVYPAQHRALANDIVAQGGALISERPPGAEVRGYSFTLRNRIIAGLSHATIVIEGTLESGSLITAKAALEYGREVFACPHPLYTSGGMGPNMLIKNGAHMLSDPQDVLDVLGVTVSTPTSDTTVPGATTPLEQHIVDLCTQEPHSIDVLVHSCKAPATTVTQTVSMLELRGILENYHGLLYAKKSKRKA